MQVITLATPAMLAQAGVLARSLRAHQPDWPHEVLLVGRLRDRDPPPGAPRVRPVAEALEGQLRVDFDRLIARYDDEDLLALLRPHVLRAYVRKLGEPVLHLPASIWVVGPLDPVGEALSASGALLVPRMT